MSDLFAESRTNAAEYTVSEISNALRRTVEDAFGNVRVRGEISGYRGPHASGHAYFSLKDESARIEAVIWRRTLVRLKFPPEEGMEVVATGRLTTFPGKSTYQIVIDALQPAGAGALMALLEERKKRLRAEGLFDEARKRRLPFMPAVIGVVTSPTGSVIRDIIHRIKDRFPLRILVWPVRVQGETAASEVAAAVRGFDALPPGGAVPRPDLIIVARGGGSLEDLWGFNDEALARAVAACRIPVISAVGHETDWTLLDLVADKRAPTPTGAAEIAVPVKAELEAALAAGAARLRACTGRGFDRRRDALKAAARALPSPDQLLALPRRRFDEASARLGRALSVTVERHRARLSAARLSPAALAGRAAEARRVLERAAHRLPRGAEAGLRLRRGRLDALLPRLTGEPLARRMSQARQLAERDLMRIRSAFGAATRLRRERFRRLSGRLALEPVERRRRLAADALGAAARKADRAIDLVLERDAARLTQADRLLATLSLSDQAILERGYAMVIGADGRMRRRAAQVAPGAELTLKFADGTAQATATGARPRTARPASGSRPGEGQGSLF